jgi:Histidine kinase
MAISAIRGAQRSLYGVPRPAQADCGSASVAPEPIAAGARTARMQPWLVILTVGGACWLLLGFSALSYAESAEALRLPAAQDVIAYLALFVSAAFAYRAALALGWPLGRGARLRAVAVHGALLLAVVSCVPLASFIGGVAGAVVGASGQGAAALGAQLAHWSYWGAALKTVLAPYLLGLCAVALMLLNIARGHEARRNAELARDCASARMAMLSAQLQPHFLFNALHALSVLVDESPRRAGAMIARLGDFLRHALASARLPWTDLASELAGIEAYLAVQQMRFGDGLSVSIEATPEALRACVPALLLQPLVENAIEHGRSDSGAVLRVHLTAAVCGARMCIVVSNGNSRLQAALVAAHFGQGLANVEQRLCAAYGTQAQLSIAPAPGATTAATLSLPWREFGPARAGARERP